MVLNYLNHQNQLVLGLIEKMVFTPEKIIELIEHKENFPI